MLRATKRQKMKTTYQTAKTELKREAKGAKEWFKTDKPAIRQAINDHADFLCKSYQLPEYKRNLLSNYACKLHPKN